MTAIDKATVRQIAEEAREALQAVAEAHGMTVKVGGGSYDPTIGTFKPKVEFSLGDAERLEFERNAPFYGFQAEDYGRQFMNPNGTFKIVGFNNRAPKRPILAEHVTTGRRYRFPESAVRSLKS